MNDYRHLIPKHTAVSHAASLRYCTPPDAISLHLGYPDPRLFPVVAVERAVAAALAKDAPAALQYTEERGDHVLRSSLCAALAVEGRTIDAESVVVTQGASEAQEIVPQLLIDKGDVIIMEAPTYLWAIRAFQFRQARLLGVPMDGEGMRVDVLASTLEELRAEGSTPKMIYVMPDFHNPTGICMSLVRRRRLLQLASEYGVVIFEDAPYVDLRYEGERLPTLFGLDDDDVVISARSFSKTISPGIRLCGLFGPAGLMKDIARMKQTGSCTLLSRAVSEYIQGSDYQDSIERARGFYREKCGAMCDALQQHCPGAVRWTRPQGGFYVWLELPEAVDLEQLDAQAAAEGVLFLNGHGCFCDATRWKSLRLSFSYESADRIREGVRALGALLDVACGR